MSSFLYVYSDHSILECYNLFSGVELSMRSFFVIIIECFVVLSHDCLSKVSEVLAELNEVFTFEKFFIHVLSKI